MGIDLPVAMSLSLFVATAPAAVVYMKIARKRNSMENGVNNFLRDLTEVRKTGLSPERCIESLSKRDYGTFTPELRKISSDISWGIPIKKVMMDFLKRTKSWMVQIVMFLLVETIDVGGGTIGMIEALFQIQQLDSGSRKRKENVHAPIRVHALLGRNTAGSNNRDDDRSYIGIRLERSWRCPRSSCSCRCN